MDWTFNNDLPIYTQLIDKIKLAIAAGQLLPGEKLSPVRDLAAEARVNPNTMQRAFQELEREGLVYSQRSSGRYVTEDTGVIVSVKKALAERYVQEFVGHMVQLGFSAKDCADMLRIVEKEDEK